MPQRFETATENPRLNGVVITCDPATGRASAIERVNMSMPDLEQLAETASTARA